MTSEDGGMAADGGLVAEVERDTGKAAASPHRATHPDDAAQLAITNQTAPDRPEDQPDWRTRLAGDDKDALRRLARFPDEAALYKSYRALEQRMSSGDYKRPLADNASAEEIAAWRRDNGLPDCADGYFDTLALPDGVVIGEADKPVVREFAAAALDGNVAPEQFNRMVAKYYEIQDAQRAAREDADVAYKQKAEGDLRADWQGPAYRQNLNAIQNLMAGWPEGLAVRVLAGRSPEGRKLGDDPAFVRQLAALARELNPPVSLVPSGSSDPARSRNDRLSEIKGWMSAAPGSREHSAYWKDEKVQAEYRELIDGNARQRARSI